MIVEDDPMVAKINKQYLSKIAGFRLEATAHSVDEAVRLLEKEEIQLIFLDIFMPGKLGLELLAYLRKNELEIDVIIISAASDLERIKKALRFGVVGYLIKLSSLNGLTLHLLPTLSKLGSLINRIRLVSRNLITYFCTEKKP